MRRNMLMGIHAFSEAQRSRAVKFLQLILKLTNFKKVFLHFFQEDRNFSDNYLLLRITYLLYFEKIHRDALTEIRFTNLPPPTQKSFSFLGFLFRGEVWFHVLFWWYFASFLLKFSGDLETKYEFWQLWKNWDFLSWKVEKKKNAMLVHKFVSFVDNFPQVLCLSWAFSECKNAFKKVHLNASPRMCETVNKKTLKTPSSQKKKCKKLKNRNTQSHVLPPPPLLWGRRVEGEHKD